MKKNHLPSKLTIFKALELISPIFPAPLYWMGTDGVVLGINELCLKAMGALSADYILGKTSYEFYPYEIADQILEHNQKVIQTKQILSQEEKIKDITTGKVKYFTSVKAPLYNEDGKVIGILGTSIETTAEKEAERLKKLAEKEAEFFKMESRIQKVLLQEKEKFSELAQKVAHDIRSPLTALTMVLNHCHELPEDKRTTLRYATQNIQDIANNLLGHYQPETGTLTEERHFIFCASFLMQLLSEKKYQYMNRPISWVLQIPEEEQFAFIKAEASQLRRALSNLINNAVEALENKANNEIIVSLSVAPDWVTFQIQDNGKGMSSDLIQKMDHQETFTLGKKEGYGLGMRQVWDMLAENEGKMTVSSAVGQGTVFSLRFPRVESPNWIAEQLSVGTQDIIVVLDDDSSIHGAWDLRFEPLLKQYRDLRLYHFEQGQEALDFINGLSFVDKAKICLLTDYELLHQKRNGLDVIKAGHIRRAILVTSHYANTEIQNSSLKLGVKVLPKEMASAVPILVQEMDEDLQILALEDNPSFTLGLQTLFKEYQIKGQIYPDLWAFMAALGHYPKNIRIMLDHDFGNPEYDGFNLAQILHEEGYTQLHLLSAGNFKSHQFPPYLDFIPKTQLEETLKSWFLKNAAR